MRVTESLAASVVGSGLWMAVRLGSLAAWVVLLARHFGADQFGWLVSILAVSAIGAMVAPLGIPYLRFGDAHRLSPAADRWSEALGAILVVGPAAAVAVTIVIALLLPPLVPLVLVAGFVAVEVCAAAFVQACALRVHADGSPSAGAGLPALLMVARFVAVGLLMLLPGADASLERYLLLHAACLALAVSAATLWASSLSHLWSWPRLPRARTIRHSMHYMLMGAASIGTSELDKPLVARVAGLDFAGHYAFSYRILAACSTPATAIAASQLPKWSRDYAVGDKAQLLKSYHASLAVALAWGGVCGAGFAWAAQTIQPGAWGIYEEVWGVVPLMWPLVAALGAHQVAGAALIAVDRPGARACIDLACLGLLAIGIGAGYHFGGTKGIALAAILAELVAALLMVLVFYQRVRSTLVTARI